MQRTSTSGSVIRASSAPHQAGFSVIIAVLVMLTSSFDTFLALQVGGTIRICQALAVILVLITGLRIRTKKWNPVLGLGPLSFWLLFQFLFIPVVEFWQKGLAYSLWLTINLLTIICFVQLFSDDVHSLWKLLRCYIWSFAVVAIFGIAQFLLPLLGYEAPLVTQWWVPGTVARANGFSYEPSYFATYLLIGFVLSSSLLRQRSYVISRAQLQAVHLLTLAGILASSSRMGIIFAFADLVLASLAPFRRLLSRMPQRHLIRRDLKACAAGASMFGLLAGVAFAGTWFVNSNPAVTLLLLNGTGVSDTAAHSVVQRDEALQDTLRVFAEHPIIGRSLGGVSVAIADLHGESVTSLEASKDFEGMSVFAEVLAASGIAGVIPFGIFVFRTIRKPLSLTSNVTAGYAPVLRALVRSSLFLWAILQLNQNILRPYLWVHLAVLATVYAAAARFPTHTAASAPQTCS